jgi:hypothetical protein
LVVGQVPKVGTGIFELIVENQAEWMNKMKDWKPE